MSQSERRLAAIMFTDIVGYTTLTQNNETLALKLLERHRDLIRPALSRYGGREVKTIGDAFLVEFGSALQATECAFEIQKILHEYNESASDKISLKIGIHVGDVIHTQGDVYGDAVNIASRIEPLAKGGGVCISGQVYDQVRNKILYQTTKLETGPLKNISLPTDVYRLDLPWERGDVPDNIALPSNRIAVLPFVNISPDPNDEFFADGLTEELITNLSLVKGLKIIARTSVMNYKKKEKNISVIGKELGVGTVVEGSVRKAANRIRVTVQVIDANTEEHLWASNYDRGLDDIFAVQSDIASRVSEAIPSNISKLKPAQALSKTEDVRAYMYFLQGKHIVHSTQEEPLRQSLRFFYKALEADPSFARAYAGVAEAYIALGNWNFITWEESIGSARVAVRSALAIDEGLAEAHALLSSIAMMSDDVHTSAAEASKAVELNPNLAQAYAMLGQCAAIRGGADEFVKQLETAYQLDPLSPDIIRPLGRALFYAGKNAEALEHWNRTLHIDPYSAYRGLSDYYMSTGDYARAEAAVQELEKIQPTGEITLLNKGYLAALRGNRSIAEEIIRSLNENYPQGSAISGSIGMIYYALGDLDRFFELMFLALDNHTLSGSTLLLSPLFATARKDPRFRKLIDKLEKVFEKNTSKLE